MSDNEILEKRMSKIINWFKNPYNLAFSIIFLFAIIIRLRYFNINTGVWWDELEYLATGKVYAGMLDYELSPARAFFFPLMIALIFTLRGGELGVRIFLELLPSIAIVFGTYCLGSSMFNKKIGLLSMLLMTIFYEHLFDMARMLSDMLSNSLELFAILVFYIFYVKGKNPRLLWLAVVLGFLGMMTRHSGALVLITIGAYMLITEKTDLFKNKNMWIAFGAGLICILAYVVYNLIIFNAPMPAITHYIFNPTTGTAALASEHGALNLSFFSSLLSWLFWPLIVFLIFGLYLFLEVLLVLDKTIKQKSNEPNPKLLIFLWIIISALFWIFIFHFTTSRWMMGLAPAVFILIAYGVEKSYHLLSFICSFLVSNKKYIKAIATILVLLFLFYGLYLEYQLADNLIKSRAGSYAQVKEVALWLKENTNETDQIIFDSQIWYTYYVQRNNSLNTNWGIMPQNYEFKNMSWIVAETPYNFVPTCEYDFDFTLNRTKKDYLVWTIYEQVYTASTAYLNKNIDLGIFVPVKAYYLGEQISGLIMKVNQEKLLEKLSSFDYSNQLIPATVQETQKAWESYKAQKGITESDICGFNSQYIR